MGYMAREELNSVCQVCFLRQAVRCLGGGVTEGTCRKIKDQGRRQYFQAGSRGFYFYSWRDDDQRFELPEDCPNPPGAVEIQCTSKRSN